MKSTLCLGVLLGLSLLDLAACGTTPSVAPPPVLLRAPVAYEGNKEYLPRTVEAAHFHREGLSIRYAYEVLAQGVLPNDMEGVKVFGKLEVLSGDSVMTSYEVTRSLNGTIRWSLLFFVGQPETLTDLRRKALFAVRDDIELRMVGDAGLGVYP